MKKFIGVIILLLSIFILGGCGNNDTSADIYTSIYPIEFLVKRVVGDAYTVRSVYPRGKDVHDYEPNPTDTISLSESKLIFYIGIGLEIFLEESLNSSLKNVPAVPLSSGLDLVQINADVDGHGGNDEHGFYDPHIWLDPYKMQKMTDTVLSSLIKYLPLTEEEIDLFTQNANTLKTDLNNLDKEFLEVINNSMISNKTIIVDHDAYVYWEQRYGIKRIRMRNDNGQPDITAPETQEKLRLAKEIGIKYVCTTMNEMESSIVNVYMRELDLPNENKVKLHHLATITSEEETNGLDYFSIMRINIKTLEKVFPKRS